MTTNRTMLLGLVLAVTALAPATAIAKHGTGDDRGGQTTASSDDTRADDNASQRAKARRAKRVVRVAGECSGDSTAKLEVKRDRGRLKTEFEVDQNVNGVAWAVKLSRNGRVVVDTTRATHAPSGSFSVERRFANGPGPDTVSATATSPSGETCTASATI